MTARSRWHWPIRLGMAALSVLAALLTAELILGRGTPRQGAAFLTEAPADSGLPYVLKPNTEVPFVGHYVKIPETTVHINAQGVRADHDIAIPKPPGLRRIITLGDSFVFGSGVQGPETFSALLDQALPHTEVINLGVPGYTSTHAVEWLRRAGLRFQPDWVLLFISDNDFYTEGRARLAERQAQGEGWAVQRWAEGRQKGKAKADSSWRQHPAVVLERLRAAFARLDQLAATHHFEARVFLLFPHPLEAQIRTLRPTIRRLADAAYLRDITRLQIPKDLHPNAEGHRRLATLLQAALAGPEAAP